MNRQELAKHITDNYESVKNTPWQSHPKHTVFRHRGNQKWFALIMDVPRIKLGLNDNGSIDVVNIKGDPQLITSLHNETGCFPAYHMNKEHWLTVALDGSADDELLKKLLDISYDLTKPRNKSKRV